MKRQRLDARDAREPEIPKDVASGEIQRIDAAAAVEDVAGLHSVRSDFEDIVSAIADEIIRAASGGVRRHALPP